MAGNMHDDVPIDMISSLPDEVLTHILSFLSTKEAVHTWILSKRWSKLWASVPVLRFDLNKFCTDDVEVRGRIDKFDKFVNGVFENRVPSHLDTFEYARFSENDNCGYETSLEWLDRVVVLNPRVIHLLMHSSNQLNLPDSIFSCASLQNLSLFVLAGDQTIIRPEVINLPSLKTLEVADADLVDCNFEQKLFQGCPALERLLLRYCNLNYFDINSDVLKELKIEECIIPEKILIYCPSLLSLSIQSSLLIKDISLVNMASLANAVIKLTECYYNFRPLPILNVLRGLSNATTIKLHFADICLKEQLEKDIARCRTFNNLKSLEIGEWDMTSEFHLVGCFLQNSPNLEELTLILNEEKSQGNTQEEPGKEVLFQRAYLKKVKIFHGQRVKSADKLVRILERHVKTIGETVILNCFGYY